MQGRIIVYVDNINESKGTIRAFLWKEGQGYPREKKKWFRKVCKPANAGKVMIIFEDVPYTHYAVSVFHDVNNNDKFDYSRLQMTVEPFGLSNNPVIERRPVPYEQARFFVRSGDLKLSIRLNHPGND